MKINDLIWDEIDNILAESNTTEEVVARVENLCLQYGEAVRRACKDCVIENKAPDTDPLDFIEQIIGNLDLTQIEVEDE